MNHDGAARPESVTEAALALLAHRGDSATVRIHDGSKVESPEGWESAGLQLWVVGGAVVPLIMPARSPVLTVEYVENWLRRALYNSNNGAEYAGIWHSQGLVYIDIVTLHDDVGEAQTTARKRGEIAIYDLVTQETQYV